MKKIVMTIFVTLMAFAIGLNNVDASSNDYTKIGKEMMYSISESDFSNFFNTHFGMDHSLFSNIKADLAYQKRDSQSGLGSISSGSEYFQYVLYDRATYYDDYIRKLDVVNVELDGATKDFEYIKSVTDHSNIIQTIKFTNNNNYTYTVEIGESIDGFDRNYMGDSITLTKKVVNGVSTITYSNVDAINGASLLNAIETRDYQYIYNYMGN